jgi:DNA-binding response OmpR family regulator
MQIMKTDARILIAEDQPSIRACIEQILKMAGFRVLSASDGAEALHLLKSHTVDLVLADIMMPNMDGYQLYERLIANPEWARIPFIFLTARVLDSDIRYGKELGVDDYLVKPVEAKDLLAVVRGKLRRARRLEESFGGATPHADPASGTVQLGPLKIEPGQYRAWIGQEALKLSTTEFRLLECLALQPNKVVPLESLVRITHGLDAEYTEASDLLRPMIRSLRRKMGHRAGDMGCIESVRGVGYRFVLNSEV